jgi:hypothetical protein
MLSLTARLTFAWLCERLPPIARATLKARTYAEEKKLSVKPAFPRNRVAI